MNTEQPQGAGDSLSARKSAAQAKWDEERGEEICYIAERLRKHDSQGVWMYEIGYRVDLLQRSEPMLIVKGIGDELPQVAFVYSQGLLTAMSNLAGLLRAGKLKWRPDLYPSGKAKKAIESLQEAVGQGAGS